jgi:urease subunit alpha
LRQGQRHAEGTGEGKLKKLGLLKQLYAVASTREVTKSSMKHNSGKPEIVIDADTFDVTIGGVSTADVRVDISEEPEDDPQATDANAANPKSRTLVRVGRNFATELPMAQRYFLF